MALSDRTLDLTAENLMEEGTKTISKVLTLANFNYDSPDKIPELKIDLSMVEADPRKFLKLSLFVLSSFFLPTLGLKFVEIDANTKAVVNLVLLNAEIAAKVCLSSKNKLNQYDALVVYRKSDLATFRGLIELQGDYLDEEGYPNLLLNPFEGEYTDTLNGCKIECNIQDRQDVTIKTLDAILPSKYHIRCEMDKEGVLECVLKDKTGKEIYQGPVDQQTLQKSSKYAITLSKGDDLNVFRNLKLTFIENLQKK